MRWWIGAGPYSIYYGLDASHLVSFTSPSLTTTLACEHSSHPQDDREAFLVRFRVRPRGREAPCGEGDNFFSFPPVNSCEDYIAKMVRVRNPWPEMINPRRVEQSTMFWIWLGRNWWLVLVKPRPLLSGWVSGVRLFTRGVRLYVFSHHRIML